MNLKQLEKIKKLAIIAMFSDDVLMDMFVLKGGNALDIVYNITPRASIDLDFSVSGDLPSENLQGIQAKIEYALKKIFSEEGYEVFDVRLTKKPPICSPDIPEFWGGYELVFKIISKTLYDKNIADNDKLRRNAEIVGLKNKKKFKIEISKREYCNTKNKVNIDGYTIYVYTPEMIVFEKLRAICQQMDAYIKTIGKSHKEARARDFFDFYVAVERFEIDITKPKNIKLLRGIFQAKNVSLSLISKIRDSREVHRPDFISVRQTLKVGEKIEDFDFYFDYVVRKCDLLIKALRIE